MVKGDGALEGEDASVFSWEGRDYSFKEGRKESRRFLAISESGIPSNSPGILGICPALYAKGFLP